MRAPHPARHGRRQREVVMTRQGKLGRWVKLIAPGVVERMAWRRSGRRQPDRPARADRIQPKPAGCCALL
jgi:hypothetical protein